MYLSSTKEQVPHFYDMFLFASHKSQNMHVKILPALAFFKYYFP